MTRPALRNRRLRRTEHKTPGGKTNELNERRKGKRDSCNLCKKKLQGVKKDGTKRTSGRKFSGELCHKCASEIIEYATRVNNKDIKINEAPIKYINYIKKIVK